MSLIKTSFPILLTLLLAASCGEDPAELLTLSSETGKPYVALQGISRSASYSFTTNGDWVVSTHDPSLTLSPMSGSQGKNTITVTSSEYNCSNSTLSSSFTINASNTDYDLSQNVTVALEPVFRMKDTAFIAKAEGDTLKVRFHCDDELAEGVYIFYDGSFASMMDPEATSVQHCKVTRNDDGSGYESAINLVITPNLSSYIRSGKFYFALDEKAQLSSIEMTVAQLSSAIGQSADTVSASGKVSLLQEHTEGRGVPIVLMGDGFIDKEIADGTYRKAMENARETIFGLEPMKSLRQYFDVYEVTAVSLHNSFSDLTSTAFSAKFGAGTLITGNDDKAMKYAAKAVSNISDALIVIVLNDTRYAGTCVLYTGNKKTDIPTGCSVAYVPMTDPLLNDGATFADILLHEAVGHGFAKLADEYSEKGNITQEAIAEIQHFQAYGFARNVALTADVTQSYWADFAADPLFASEQLSCYEGAYTYLKGAYRPTQNSMMNENAPYFNAPSRVMIYKRCMSIAYGSAWSYDYATFVAFDAPARKEANSQSPSAASKPSPSNWCSSTRSKNNLPRLSPPIIRIME